MDGDDEAAVVVTREADQGEVAFHFEAGDTPDPAEDGWTRRSCMPLVSLLHKVLLASPLTSPGCRGRLFRGGSGGRLR
jgi:hypothetical protein